VLPVAVLSIMPCIFFSGSCYNFFSQDDDNLGCGCHCGSCSSDCADSRLCGDGNCASLFISTFLHGGTKSCFNISETVQDRFCWKTLMSCTAAAREHTGHAPGKRMQPYLVMMYQLSLICLATPLPTARGGGTERSARG